MKLGKVHMWLAQVSMTSRRGEALGDPAHLRPPAGQFDVQILSSAGPYSHRFELTKPSGFGTVETLGYGVA
jgi:hypothetical protein